MEEIGEGDYQTRSKGITYEHLLNARNIVDLLKPDQLPPISAKVCEEYDIDKESRKDWEEKNKDAIDLAMMVAEEKNYPFARASNVKYPLIATAALQFQARAYPAICPPDRVVKAKTFGADPDGQKERRADRVSEHMSWQCLEQMPEWEGDTDRLTLQVSILGSMYRKVFYNPSLKRKETRLISPDRLVFNYWGRFVDLPRITEELYLYPYEIAERISDGRFAKFDYANMAKSDDDRADERDSSGPHLFLEQHRLLDLDEDGYPEPYVVTVHKSSQEVCRIVANWSPDTAVVEQTDKGTKVVSIRKNTYYIQYLFLPSPDGGSMGMGFGWLLKDLNDSINTTLNQTFDAAHMSIVQGGFISAQLGPKQRNATFRIEQGEWKYLNTTGPLNQAIMPITYPGPSPVLMTLLEFLINSGKELASIKDVLTGETPATAPVGTTMALIEQGLQVFTSIYKRLYRALKAEFRLHAELNRKHVTQEEYQQFFDGEEMVDPRMDYDLSDMGISPISDPQAVTKPQRIAKAQAVYGISAENPTINKMEATKRFLEAIGEEEIEQLLVPPPPPDPEVEALAKRAAIAEVEAKEGEAEAKNADATNKLATAMKSMAEAGQIDVGQITGALEMLLKMITAEHGMEMDIAGQGRVPGMEGQPNDAGGVLPAGGADQIPAGSADDQLDESDFVPADGMGGGAADVGAQQGVL